MGNKLALQREMNPADLGMLKSIAEITSQARSEQIKIAKHLIFCYENNLPLSLAVNGGLYTVNGRVEVEGTVIRGQIRKSPDYDYKIVTLTDKECTIAIETLVNESNGIMPKYEWQEIGQASFTIEDAKQAGLIKPNSPWEKYPTDMLLNRATSRAYKRFCPDIFMQSVYVNGEISNQPKVTTIDSDGVIVPTIDEMMRDNPQGVLDAMNATDGSQQAVYEYLQEVE
jgi:hypothetical protein